MQELTAILLTYLQIVQNMLLISLPEAWLTAACGALNGCKMQLYSIRSGASFHEVEKVPTFVHFRTRS